MGILSWLGLEAEPEKEPLEVNDDNFGKEVLKSDIPVLLDVWSLDCPHCHKLVPTIKKLAAKYDSRVKVTHLNLSTNRRTAGKIRVKGTPTVLVYNKGSEYERVVGVRGQHFYEEILNELVPPLEENTQESAPEK